MKPPPRRRRKRNRILEDEAVYVPRLRAAPWQTPELLRLLAALRKLREKGGGKAEIDYGALKSAVPARSVSEIQLLVESLRDEVITRASMNLKKRRWSENRIRRPIQLWTDMASEVTGALEEPISLAFSQMLSVSSIEPCTVNYSNVSQIHRPATYKDETIGPSIPVRSTPSSPFQVLGKHPSSNTALWLVQTPAASNSKVVKSLNGKIPPPQQQPSITAGTSPAATSQSAASLNPGPTTISTTSTSSSHPTAQSTCASISTLVLNTTPSTIVFSYPAASTHAAQPLSTPTAATQARFGRLSDSVARDSPDMLGDKYVVNFEKIYRYLSVIQKPDEKCHLTAMESAIVLDLLMSLPEELPLLNCNKLHQHLLEVYQCLSSPADSKTASEIFKKLKDESRPQTEVPRDQTSNTTNGQKNSTGSCAPSSDVTSSSGKETLPEEARRKLLENNTSNQSGDLMDLHLPLNPFMIPLKMLMRRQVRVPHV